MCGIVGVVGSRQGVAAQVAAVLNGLRRLEYRGYDSAGIAAQGDGAPLAVRKASGKLAALEQLLLQNPFADSQATAAAIGHTRWATHGAPTETNAHPHLSQWHSDDRKKVAVVHNGIIENYQELRAELGSQGAIFASQTDTETLPMLVSFYLKQGATLTHAVQQASQRCSGSFAFVAMQDGHPDELVATRRGAPLCVGLGNGSSGTKQENFFCSDPLALAGLTSRFIFLEENDTATLTPAGVTIHNGAGQPVERAVKTLDLSADLAGKQGFRHFMLKEIHEQPAVVGRLLAAYTDATSHAVTLPLTIPQLARLTSVNVVACGTAYYAGQVGKYFLEQFAGLPVNVDVASEFRYRQPPFQPGGIFIAVSQSGETADTLAALEHAKAAGQHVIVLTNTPTSSMARAADDVIDLLAGREVAVASTKAFTAMVLALALLALRVGHAAGKLSDAQAADHVTTLRTLPAVLDALLTQQTESTAEGQPAPLVQLAESLTCARSMLYLGRGLLAPLATEGALKMKEISYIHAEGYASGEMKHGPIALVDPSLPVVNLASSSDGLFEKTLSNLKEVEARHGRVILITDSAAAAQLDAETSSKLTLLELPTVPALLVPFVFTLPLQLLAYHTATAKGTDVDQPRNLAKSVTVE